MEPFFCTEDFDYYHRVPSHSMHNRRWPGAPYRSSGDDFDDRHKRSGLHLRNAADDFTMDAADNYYDVYDNQHYGWSGSRMYGSQLRNERLSYPLSRWDSRPCLQGGNHDNEQIDWAGDFGAYVNQSQEVQNDQTMLHGVGYPGDYILSFGPAGLPVRGLRPTEPREEVFSLPEDNHESEYHHSWCTDLPATKMHPLSTLSPTLDEYFSRQFFQHLPKCAKASDLTDARDDNDSNIDLPTLIQATTTDGASMHHNPPNFDSTSSIPKSTGSQHGDFFKQQWRILRITAAGLHRQRRRIRHSLRVLHRAQQAFELERGEFRNVQKISIQDPEGNQKWHSIHERFGLHNSDNAWRRDTKHLGETRGKRTEQAREKDLMHEASRSSNERRRSSEYDYRQDSEHHYDGGPHEQRVSPPLTADVVSQAKNDLASYDSAWTSLSEQFRTNRPRIPYPTSTMHCGPLLNPFPSNVRLPRLAAFHPPAHVRIQFHALAFYLHPLGLQVSLTCFPSVQGFDDPEQVPDAVVGVEEIDRLHSRTLMELKLRVHKEIRTWHEDTLRKKGFGTLLDCGSAISQDLDRISKESQYSNNSECVMGNVHDLEEKLTERNIVQGVWAAVQFLKDLVNAEMKRRNMM